MISFQDFCDAHDNESWQGYSTAFRAGARARVQSLNCNYTRYDFIGAWQRGYHVMDRCLASGDLKECNILFPGDPIPQDIIINRRQSRISARIIAHKYGQLVEECECDHCMAKKATRVRQAKRRSGGSL